jgi:ssDNA thymidine ADP-ribosyltransferase, DarT
MLYRTEGIKRYVDEWPHCPRPVYLVFSPQVALLPGVRISDGNMRSGGTSCPEALTTEFVRSLPFSDIFGRGPLPRDPDVKREINRRRQAELLVPGELSLNYLTRMIFRSEAERDLANRDVPELESQSAVEVNGNWFYAGRTGRPYLKTFANTSFDVANVAKGDHLVEIDSPRRGDTIAFRCEHDGNKWSDWQVIEVGDFSIPNRGWNRVYLNGWRVAEWPES